MAGSLERWRTIARAAFARDDVGRLERACAALLKADPSDEEARRLLGRDALRDQRFAEAEDHLRLSAARNPSSPTAWAELARAYAERRIIDQAEATLSAAFAQGVADAPMLTFLGRLRQAQGNESAARASFEAAIDLDPAHGDAYRGLAETGGLSAGEPLRILAERRVEDPRTGPLAAAAVAYALAEAAAGDGDRALMRRWLVSANRRQREARPPETLNPRAPSQRWIARLRRASRAAPVVAARLDVAPPTEPPVVFVMGPAGAGAPLVEHALTREAHIQAFGTTQILAGPIAAAARMQAKRPAATAGRWLSRGQRVGLARDYLRRLSAYASPNGVLSDGDEANVALAPLAASLFANARFVRVRRDLRDATLAVFRRADPAGGAHTCDLRAIANALALSERALTATADIAPMVEARFEDFAADASSAARSLAKALDLPVRDSPAEFAPAALGLQSWEAGQSAQRIAPGDWRAHETLLEPATAVLRRQGVALEA